MGDGAAPRRYPSFTMVGLQAFVWVTAEGAEMVFMNGLTEKIIGAAIEVHKVLGPGLLESAYDGCLAHALCEHWVSVVVTASQ